MIKTQKAIDNMLKTRKLYYVYYKKPQGEAVWCFVCKICQKDSFYPMGWHYAYPEMMVCKECYRKT